jgi:hypothetical protein
MTGSHGTEFIQFLSDAQCMQGGPAAIIGFDQGVFRLLKADCVILNPSTRLERSEILINTRDTKLILFDGKIFRQGF